MKKLSELITDLSDISESYEMILSDPKVKDMLEKYEGQYDMRFLASFTRDLNQFAREIPNCEGCPGIHACKQGIKGHFPALMPHLGRLRISYEPCQYFKAQAHLAYIESFHMPKHMADISFDDLIADPSREQLFGAASQFVLAAKNGDLPEKGLYLHGSMGSGKTYAMCVIANELAKLGIATAIVYFPELIATIRSSFNKTDESSEELVEKLKNIPVLMLDDLGSEQVTAWMRDDVLGRIINHRMMYKLPTFFTSNFNLEELEVHYAHTTKNDYEPVKAARIMERIKAISTPIEMVGKNYRR